MKRSCQIIATNENVILNEVKNLNTNKYEILRGIYTECSECAQNDPIAGIFK